MPDTEKQISVMLDTNFLIDLFRFRLDFDDVEDIVGKPCSFLMVRQSVRELEKIKVKYARVGLRFVDSGKINIVDAPGVTADDAIISILSNAKKRGNIKEFAFATNDAKLRKKIKDLGVKVIYLRARKHLEIMN